MKLRPPLLSIIIALSLSFEASARENAQPEPESTGTEMVSPTDAAEESNETEAMPDEVESPSPAEEAFQRALQHEQNNEFDKAIADYTEAIGFEPENLIYLSARGELYSKMRNYNKALEDAGRILELDPANLSARILRGRMLDRSGGSEKALMEFNAAVEQNPTSLQALSERQNFFERNGQHDKALADGNRMIQLEPNSSAGYEAQARAHATSGEYDQAMTYASALIQQDPDNPFGYITRAKMRAERADFEGAKQDLATAIGLSPDNPTALSVRSAIYFETREYDKSLADLEKAVAVEPDYYGFKAQLADFLATCPDDHLRDATRASQLANEALKLAPNDPLVWRACASAAAENGAVDEAIKWQEQIMSSKAVPFYLRYENELRLESYRSGKAYRQNTSSPNRELMFKRVKEADQALKNNDFDRAVAVLSEMIAADPSDDVPYYGRGQAYSRQKKYHLALTDLDVAIRLKPENLDAYNERGYVLENINKYEQALEDFKKVENANKNDKRGTRNNLAWLLATCPDDRVRDAGKAAEFIDEALQSHPDDAPIWDTCAAVFAEMGDFEDAVEWEQAYLDRQDLSGDQRGPGKQRLALYKANKPYRQQPEQTALSAVTVSTTPAQPEK